MRRGLVLRYVCAAGLALAGGCYAGPEPSTPCVILCTDTCPGDLSCKNGYCAGGDEDCAPEFRQVSAGGGYACALDGRDRLWCWGTNARHQIDATDAAGYTRATLIGTTTWQTLTTGGGQTCGIHAGELSCWGANDRGQVSGAVLGDVREPLTIEIPGTPASWSAVATGYQTTCGIADGKLYCWGAGDKGVLGNGGTVDAPLPSAVTTTIADWTAVSIGYALDGGKLPRSHACAISPTAGLWCWGGNDTGELGDGTTTASTTPIQITLPSPPTSVAAAGYSTCATTSDGRLLCWGLNGSAQVGDPLVVTNTGNVVTPTEATLLTGWTKVVAAEQMLCGLRADEVWCWGSSSSGGMGNGVWSSQRTFSRVTVGATELSVAPNTNIDDSGTDTADLDLACAVIAGDVKCWGSNQLGQLAQGATTLSAKPVAVRGDHHFTKLAAGSSHMCGLAEDQLLCWGSTVAGQVAGVASGNQNVPCGSLPDLACDVSVPTPLRFATGVRELNLGFNHTCALGDSLWCWGDDSLYQLAAASLGPAPAEVPGPWTKLFPIRGNGSCATQAGQTQCWGAVINNQQPLGHIAELDAMTAIAISGSVGPGYTAGFGCALDATQQLSCFGPNQFGQYGNGNRPSTCGNAICDAGEGCETCAQDCSGCAATCPNGACDAGETFASCPADCGAGPLTRTGRHYRAISLGYGSNSSGGPACGITEPNGTIECWGRNRNGVAGVLDGTTGRPLASVFKATALPNLTGCTQVSVGDAVACAVCGGEVSCWGDHRRGAVGAGPVTASPVVIPRKIDVSLEEDEFEEVAVGSGFACARTKKGALYCWGSNIHGALGTGVTGANLPTSIQR